MLYNVIISSILFLVLVVMNEVQRRSLIAAVGLNLILPILLIPLWIHNERVAAGGWFIWVKVYSVVGAVTFFTLMRHTWLGERRWAPVVCYLLLVGNLIEAAIEALLLGNLLNAVAALLLVLTAPTWRGARVDRRSAHRDLVWEFDRSWLIGFTLWDLAFIYGIWPWAVLNHAAVLGSSLLIGLKRPDLWAQARGFTLTVYLLLYMTFNEVFGLRLQAEVGWMANDTASWWSQIVSLAFMLVLTVVSLGQRTRPAPARV